MKEFTVIYIMQHKLWAASS